MIALLMHLYTQVKSTKTLSSVQSRFSLTYLSPIPTHFADGFGILFLPASLNEAALTCLEWIGLSMTYTPRFNDRLLLFWAAQR